MASPIMQLDHLRIPFVLIECAANYFDDKYIIGKGGLGNVYKGNLLWSSNKEISARRLDPKYGLEFLTEISVLSSLKHKNIVELIGFCDEEGEKIIINSYHAKGSLMMHLSDPTLTWVKRRIISVQVALAMNYLYYQESKHLIIHRNINSSTILLDDDYGSKLSGFEYSIKVPLDRKHHVHHCEAMGTRGYMDPAIENNGGVNHKSDVYCFGVVLFEILCGRKAYQDNSLLAPLAKFHYEQGTFHPDLWKQMDPKSFKCFSEAAYSCLESDWTRRPHIDQVLYKLADAIGFRKDNLQTLGDNKVSFKALKKYKI